MGVYAQITVWNKDGNEEIELIYQNLSSRVEFHNKYQDIRNKIHTGEAKKAKAEWFGNRESKAFCEIFNATLSSPGREKLTGYIFDGMELEDV